MKSPQLLLKELSLDTVIRRLVEHVPNNIIISYPSRTSSSGGFQDFTSTDLDRLTKAVISVLPERLRNPLNDVPPGERPVVGVVGVSNLEYHLYFLALQRLGWRTLLMSPRLADQGFAHLIRQTKCEVVLASGVSVEAMERVKSAEGFDIYVVPMVDLQRLDEVGLDDFPLPVMEVERTADSPQLIIHSSGTTGLPKPVPLNSGEWLLQNAELVERMPQYDTLTTLPVFHSFGLGSLFRILVSGRRLSVMSAERPITASALLEALDLTGSQTVITVPQVLKFCSEVQGGPARLAQIDSVVLAGSAVPQQLGDDMVKMGVTISTIYGQTESGGLMRPGSGEEWCWVSPLPHAKPFMKFESVEGEPDLFHLVILPGLPTKMLSNRDDGSYATNDLFERHPTDPGKWKFAGRADDVIVLVNGEKADPTPLEDALSLNVNVRVAVVFGAGRDSLGVLIIPSQRASALSQVELLESIMPDLDVGNGRVPAYARVSSDSVIFKDVDFEVPTTAKSTIIRPRLLELCSADIDGLYGNRELQDEVQVHVADDEVVDVVRETVELVLSTTLANESDFFQVGMDSLQASHVRSRILRRIDLGGRLLAGNVVFEYPTVESLAKHILDVRNGHHTEDSAEARKLFAESLVHKYTCFPTIERGNPATVAKQVILLTGATGTIGRHLLHYLARQPDVTRIFCLVRAKDDAIAKQRIVLSIAEGRLDDLDVSEMAKISPLAASLGEPKLGLDSETYDSLRCSVTTVIHGAWAVNFNMSLRSFQEPYLSSVTHLLSLAMQSPQSPKPTFCFLSSVASALRVRDYPIKEIMYEWEDTSDMGYGQSKWVAERICASASSHAEGSGIDFPVRVIRVGQVAGDTRYGIWNPAETIPIIVQSAITTGVLPIMDGLLDTHFWLPVDLAAVSIVEIALHKSKGPAARVFHVANATPVRWGSEFLPALRSHGMHFEAIPASDWLRRVGSDTNDNPARPLLEWFRQRYEAKTGSEAQEDKLEMDLTVAKEYSSTLRNGMQISNELVGKFLNYWQQLDGWKAPKNLEVEV
ncbi:hypothetical protein GGS20DRAFT_27949 [Poronia punctata]|nr:hypothetical protein GGS20DRAFT_27949 [Poronia punctata]